MNAIVVTRKFAAVIDGMTSQASWYPEGKTTGRMASELLCRTITNFPEDIDSDEAILGMTKAIDSCHRQYGMLDTGKAVCS